MVSDLIAQNDVTRIGRKLLIIAIVVTLLLPLLICWSTPVQAAGIFSDPAFQKVWSRTDQALAGGGANRSWFWGPESFAHTSETYLQSPNGHRKVLYFDKSRMEINDPNGDKNSAYYVTNGLLTKELVSGALQTGDNSFLPCAPANIPVAGDPTSATTPTYASMAPFTTLSPGEHTAPAKGADTVVTDQLDRNGNLSQTSNNLGVNYAYYVSDTNHNIPNVFWNWMNEPQSGFDPGAGIDWVYVLGYPISEPYWTNTQIGGQNKQVLIQLFQRRALTYTPTNNAPFKVEMGNIGQHYYRWRTSLGPSTLSLTSQPQGDYRLLAAGKETNGPVGFNMFSISGDGSTLGPRYNIVSHKVSPNGNYMAFTNIIAQETSNNVTFSVVALNSTATPLELPLPTNSRLYGYTWQGGTETSLNLIVSVLVPNGSNNTASILLYNIANPNASPKTLYSTNNTTLLNPTVSPDGRLLLIGQSGESSGLYLIRLDKTDGSAQLVNGTTDYCYQGGADNFGSSATCTSFEWSSLSGTPASNKNEFSGTFAYLHTNEHKLYQVDLQLTNDSLNEKSKTLATNAADFLGWQPNGNLVLYISRENSDYIYATLDATNPSNRFELRRTTSLDPVLPFSLERWLDITHLLSGDDISNAKILNYNGSGEIAITNGDLPKPIETTLSISPTRLAYLSESWSLVLIDRDGYNPAQVINLTKYGNQASGKPSYLKWFNFQPD
ncbi:MAG: hypothetical protein WCS37_14630 [Chloroflexota bacterium]|nr:hypothetical protein [Chloroflexota bacterium]